MPGITNEEISTLLKLKLVFDNLLDFETKEPDKKRHPTEYSSCGIVSLKHLSIKEARGIRDVLISLKDEIDMLDAAKKVAEHAKANTFLSEQAVKDLMGDPLEAGSEKKVAVAAPVPAVQPTVHKTVDQVEPVIPRRILPEDSLPPRPLKMPEGFSDS